MRQQLGRRHQSHDSVFHCMSREHHLNKLRTQASLNFDMVSSEPRLFPCLVRHCRNGRWGMPSGPERGPKGWRQSIPRPELSMNFLFKKLFMNFALHLVVRIRTHWSGWSSCRMNSSVSTLPSSPECLPQINHWFFEFDCCIPLIKLDCIRLYPWFVCIWGPGGPQHEPHPRHPCAGLILGVTSPCRHFRIETHGFWNTHL